MTDQHHDESVWRKAWREARTLLLVVLVATLGFQVFAATAMPWEWTEPEAPEMEQATDEEIFGTDTNEASDLPIDTVATDTTAMMPEQVEAARRDSIVQEKERVADSIARAKQEKIDSTEKAEATTVPTTNDDHSFGSGVKAIDTERAKKVLDTKSGLFIDARRADQFANGHIAGAINIYAYEFGDNISKILDVPRDRLIVVYCDGGACDLSHELSDELLRFGFKRVVIYQGGWEEWIKTDYPTGGGE